jgi:hypothetical protein
MSLYDSHKRSLAIGDLVMHYDSGRIGFILGFDENDDSAVSVFILNKARYMFKNSFSRVKDGF